MLARIHLPTRLRMGKLISILKLQQQTQKVKTGMLKLYQYQMTNKMNAVMSPDV
jgi:hypothetical protein